MKKAAKSKRQNIVYDHWPSLNISVIIKKKKKKELCEDKTDLQDINNQQHIILNWTQICKYQL